MEEEHKTLKRIIASSYWPAIPGDVYPWWSSSLECQLMNQPAIPKVLLHPLHTIEVLFECIGTDLIRPFQGRAVISLFIISTGLHNMIVHHLLKESGPGTRCHDIRPAFPDQKKKWIGSEAQVGMIGVCGEVQFVAQLPARAGTMDSRCSFRLGWLAASHHYASSPNSVGCQDLEMR